MDVVRFARKVFGLEYTKNSIYFVSPEVVQIFAVFITGVAVAKILGPEQLGLAKFVGLIYGYSNLVQLGVDCGRGLKLPLLVGQKKYDLVDAYLSASFSFVLRSLSLAAFVLVGTLALFHRERLTPVVWLGVASNIAISFIHQVLRHHIGKSRFHYDFRTVSISKFLIIISTALFTLIGAYCFNLAGYFVAGFFFFLPSLFYVTVVKKIRISPKTNWVYIRELIVLGFPLIIAGTLFTIYESIDRWFVMLFGGAEQLGYYSIAVSLTGVLVIIPIRLTSVFSQYLREFWGKCQDPTNVWDHAVLFATSLAIGMIPLILVAREFITLLITLFLHQYVPSLPLLVPFMLIVYVQSSFHVLASFFVIADRKRDIITIHVMALIACLVFDFIAVKILNGGMKEIAYATLATYLTSIGLAAAFSRRLKCVVLRKEALLFFIGAVALSAMLWGLPKMAPAVTSTGVTELLLYAAGRIGVALTAGAGIIGMLWLCGDLRRLLPVIRRA